MSDKDFEFKAVVRKEVIRMKCNIGKTDRIVRVSIGLIVIAVGIYLKSWWGVVGLLPIVTSAIQGGVDCIPFLEYPRAR